MSTLLKCFLAEIGLSPFDQPNSGVGSKCIYSANLFFHFVLHLEFSSAFLCATAIAHHG